MAPAGDQRAFGAGLVQLEHEAGVIVEAAAEACGEFDRVHVDAARGEEAGPGLEQIERAVERNLGVGCEVAQLARRFVGIAGDREEALDQGARFARQPESARSKAPPVRGNGRQSQRRRRPPTAAMPAIEQQIHDQVMRFLRVGIGECREHALVFGRAVGVCQRQLVEIVGERGFAVEILDQAAPPRRREIERGDKGGK